MGRKRWTAGVLIFSALAAEALAESSATKRRNSVEARQELPGEGEKVLWQEPLDMEHRDLLHGVGGRSHEPSAAGFEFVKEDMDATNPKFTVRDASGNKWKIKLGDEARPETAATRFVWAAGYYTDEDYFLPEVHVHGLPEKIHRGKQFIGPDGTMRGARLERELSEEKKVGEWKWAAGPFTGTREWNGLRVMMALINNWDVKDENNSIYRVKGGDGVRLVYAVSDLGATSGPEHLDLGRKTDKGDITKYRRTTFIRHIHPEEVDFTVPGSPSLVMIVNPVNYFRRRQLMWIGHHVPREDARWIGALLARLSAGQIRDAFRAGGFSAQEVEEFASIIEKRIASLNEL